MLHPLPCYRVSKMERPKKWPKQSEMAYKWPKWDEMAQIGQGWNEMIQMVQNKGEKSIGICKQKYIKGQMFELGQILL